MINWPMKIAFAGDSFCMSDARVPDLQYSEVNGVLMTRPSWPLLVAKKLNAEIIQLGHGGQHFFNAINMLIPNILLADIIVMCVSEPYRVFNNYSLPINNTWVEQMTTKTGNHWETRQEQADHFNMPVDKIVKVANASKEYYDHIFDTEIAEMTQLASVSFIDQLLKEHNKKVIWFPCFYHSFQMPLSRNDATEYKDEMYYKAMKTRIAMQQAGPGTGRIANSDNLNMYYLPISGPSANIPLNEVSQLELLQQDMFVDHDGTVKQLSDGEITYKLNNDGRCNHFNDENNINLAELVLDTIKKHWRSRYTSFLPEVIKIEEYFPKINFDEKATVRS